MSGMNLDFPDLKIDLDFSCSHEPGSIRLDHYPLLVYSPESWGPGVRTEDNGSPVSEIVEKTKEISDIHEIATFFKTTQDHIKQAINYNKSCF